MQVNQGNITKECLQYLITSIIFKQSCESHDYREDKIEKKKRVEEYKQNNDFRLR